MKKENLQTVFGMNSEENAPAKIEKCLIDIKKAENREVEMKNILKKSFNFSHSLIFHKQIPIQHFQET